MSRTYDFILDIAAAWAAPPARLLDFGCGGGEVVEKALARGYDARGVDTYDDMWAQYAGALARLPERISRTRPGAALPFDDAAFDVVVTNQVLEHVPDLPAVARELARVLRPGGILVAIFPTREVWIEPHLHVPLLHRLATGAPAQRALLGLCHRLGCGDARAQGRADWVAWQLRCLGEFIFHRSLAESVAALAPGFTLVARGEAAFLRDRLARSARLRRLAPLLAPRLFDRGLDALGLRLANAVLVLRRTPPGPEAPSLAACRPKETL